MQARQGAAIQNMFGSGIAKRIPRGVAAEDLATTPALRATPPVPGGEPTYDLIVTMSLLDYERMKGCCRIAFLCFTICLSLQRTPTLGENRDTSTEHRCAAAFGTTGAALPGLIREAIKVFPRDQFALRPDQVVYVTDFNGFVECMGVRSESARNYLFRQELIVFHNDFPIYFNPNEEAVKAFRTDGRASYLKYLFASFIGNGWIHATGEKSDYPAYSFELSLLKRYKRMLPPGDRTEEHFEEVRGLMEEAKSAEQKTVSVVRTSQNH